MAWSTPDFVEITLCMEVTAYVNTDDGGRPEEEPTRTDVADATSAPRELPA